MFWDEYGKGHTGKYLRYHGRQALQVMVKLRPIALRGNRYQLSPDINVFFSNSCRYILEGKELEFYQKKIQKKKGKGAAA